MTTHAIHAARTVRLVLEYFHPWPNSAGFYVARDRGWYAESGLDVEIATYDPGPGDSLEYVLADPETWIGATTNALLPELPELPESPELPAHVDAVPGVS